MSVQVASSSSPMPKQPREFAPERKATPRETSAPVPAAPTKDPAALFENKKAAKTAAAEAPTVATPAQVADRYFDALNRRDLKTLDGLYAKDARFDDNVFHFSSSAGTLGMWSKLPKDAQVKHEITSVDGNTVHAKLAWSYTLAGKQVHNDETATLTVENGKITAQREHFDFGTWAHQLAPMVPRALLNFAEPVLVRLIGLFT